MAAEIQPVDARPFSTGEVTRFFLPLAIQALSQSITYPLVASVASHGPGGPLNLAGLVQAIAVMSLLGTLGMGLITTGMVHGRSREGFARFVAANHWICASVVLLQMLLWLPPVVEICLMLAKLSEPIVPPPPCSVMPLPVMSIDCPP